MELFFTVLAVVVIAIARPVLKAVAQNVYNKTGYNGLAAVPKFLMYVISLATILLASLAGMYHILFAVGIIILGIALMSLVNIKAGIPSALLLGFTQVFCGAASIITTIVSGMLRVAGIQLRGNGGSSLSVDEALNISRAQVEKNEAERVQYQTDRANAYAQNQGFQDADEAERYGIKTGKPQQ